MIKKLLFTFFVAVIVLVGYKLKNQRNKNQEINNLPEGKLSVQHMACIIVGFIVLFSSIFYTLNWIDNQSLLTVRVINSNSNITEYQVKKDALKGRKFTTADNREIELGDNERLEILPQ